MSRTIAKRIIFSTIIYSAAALYLCAVIGLLKKTTSGTNLPDTPGYFAAFEVLFFFVIVALLSLIYAQIATEDNWELLKRLANNPGKGNYVWQGGFSGFTFLILFVTMIFRTVSCLQLCKFMYREVLSWDKDLKAKRPNVSPLFQEVYFILWAIFIITQLNNNNVAGPVVEGLNIYFIIESFTWIMYYSVLRRFFEGNYSIYHVLEHLPIIIMLIPMQAIAYAKLGINEAAMQQAEAIETPWKKILEVLLGQASEHQVLFSVIGFIYSAIVISMILSMFPAENVKAGNPDTMIIGAGDVVKNRLLPALLKRENILPEHNRGTIDIYDLDNAGKTYKKWMDNDEGSEDSDTCIKWKSLGFKTEDNVRSIFSLIDQKPAKGDKVAWVCTPSDTHWYYLNLLLEKVNFVVMEKPVASGMSDLAHFEEFANDENREKVFFLSYYLLEKGLPLTFLCRPRKLYLNYLKVYRVVDDLPDYSMDKDNEKDRKKKKEKEKARKALIEEFYNSYIKAGKVKRFSMRILEGKDERKLPEGGQWTDTFIHNVIIASMFLGAPSTWSKENWISTDAKNGHIELKAVAESGADIHLTVKKSDEYKGGNKIQDADIEFADGSIFKVNFDKKYVVNTSHEPPIALAVPQKLGGKYDVQCAMVYDCYANSIKNSEVDGLYLQLDALKWILREYNKHK